MGRKRSGRGGGGAVEEKCPSSGTTCNSANSGSNPNSNSNRKRSNNNNKKKRELSQAMEGVSSAARLTLQLQLQQMFRNPNVAELQMPSSLSVQERAFVHANALSMGLCTKSRGSGKFH